jgi:uncharacterized protein (TIGR00661 family)
MDSFSQTHKHAFKIMISCAGLGMGNASRICAILEALYSKAQRENASITCHVVSWGAGYLFLNNFKKNCNFDFELTQIQNYERKANIIDFLKCYFSNNRKLKLLINQFKPDLLILDSDYHLLSHINIKIPKISIGQASDVLDRIPLTKYKAKNISEKLTLFFREELDACFQKIISSKVLVPTFVINLDSSFKSNSNLIKIPLIVREEFLRPISNIEISKNSIGVLLSGSEIDKDEFLKLKLEQPVEIISPNQKESNILSHAKTLDKFDIIFTQGGLSSISEVVARKKFFVVFPIKNHPEQIINALEVERLGLGMKSSLEDLKDFPKLLKSIYAKKEMANRTNIDCSGAQKAALIIFQHLH